MSDNQFQAAQAIIAQKRAENFKALIKTQPKEHAPDDFLLMVTHDGSHYTGITLNPVEGEEVIQVLARYLDNLYESREQS